MKRVLWIALVIMLLSMGLVQAASNIRVTLLNQDPDPVEPGDYVDVRVKIENSGIDLAQDVRVRFEPAYPFTLETGTSERFLGTMRGYQTGEEAAIERFRLRVDTNAIDGDNDITFSYHTLKSGWVELQPFTVHIDRDETLLMVDNVISQPHVVISGDEVQVTIKVSNLGTLDLKDLRFGLDFTGLPFSPIGSTNVKTFKSLDAGQSATVTYTLISDYDAIPGIYRVPFSIIYTDENNNEGTITTVITLIVGDVPSLAVTLEDASSQQPGTQSDVSFKFVNQGLNTLRFLNVKLTPGEGYRLLSTAEDYIGNIDSDDYETADYTIYIEPTTTGKILFPLSYTYQGQDNQEYNGNVELELPLYTLEEATQLGLVKGNGSLTWIYVIIVVVVGFIGYRMWRKRKTKKILNKG